MSARAAPPAPLPETLPAGREPRPARDRPAPEPRVVPASIGPYRITGVLGRGGMGVVYRAEHSETGEAVALKTVFATDELTLGSLRREVRALGRVRHPGIVRILGEGVHEGVPWYAMELLEGRTLGDVLRGDVPTAPRADASVTVPDALDPDRTVTSTDFSGAGGPISAPGVSVRSPPAMMRSLAIVRSLCSALAHLHGRGLVHRDLKPENIFVRAGDVPVLVDLGIAGDFGGEAGREELAIDGRVVGSVAYMAPEQIRGELVDARADLYALGCILYECVTGATPFGSGPVSAVLHGHLHRPPPPPSTRAAGVPAGIDQLVMRLLEKRPHDRPGYAADVAEALLPFAPLEAEAASERPPAYVYRPDFTGRADALARFDAALGRAVAGAGGRLFVGGESGVGKTRLLLEMGRAAVLRRVPVVSGQCTALVTEGARVAAGSPLSPFHPLFALMADRCRAAGEAETARVFGPRARVLAPYEHALLSLPGVATAPEPPALPPEAARARVIRAIIDCIREHTRAAPLVLVLDDLHWADDLTLAVIGALGRPDAAVPNLLFVGAYRVEETPPALAALVPDGERIVLDRVGVAGVRSLVSGMLALPDPPEPLVAFLADVSSGNPFFLGEYLRAAIAEGLLTRDRAGAWHLDGGAADRIAAGVPLPRSLADLIERRLAGLDGAAREVAEAAGVLGREVEVGVLADLIDLDEGVALDALATLRVRQILEDRGPGVLRFVHDKIRETACARLEPARRAELHRRAALALEARYGEAPEIGARLAHHFAGARMADRAAVAYERAAGWARATYANEDAIAFFREALLHAGVLTAAPPSNTASATPASSSPDAASPAPAPPSPDTASPAPAPQPSDPASPAPAPPSPGTASPAPAPQPSDTASAIPASQPVSDADPPPETRMSPPDLPASPRSVAASRLFEGLGDVLALVGRSDEARAAFESAITRASEHARVARARLHRKVAESHEAQHRHDDTLRACDEAERALGSPEEDGGSLPDEAWEERIQIQTQRIGVFYWRGEVESIRRIIDSVSPWIHRVGSAAHRAGYFHLLTMMGARRERFAVSDETVGYARSAFLAASGLSDRAARAEEQFTLGFVLLFRGELGEASALLRGALGESEALGGALLRVRSLTYLAIAARRRADVEDCRKYATPALAASQDLRAADYAGAAEANLAWVHLRSGDPTSAEVAARSALDRWRALGHPYPFEWLARLPLLGLAAARLDHGESAAHARAVLAPSQMRWPAPTELCLERIAAGDSTEKDGLEVGSL